MYKTSNYDIEHIINAAVTVTRIKLIAHGLISASICQIVWRNEHSLSLWDIMVWGWPSIIPLSPHCSSFSPRLRLPLTLCSQEQFRYRCFNTCLCFSPGDHYIQGHRLRNFWPQLERKSSTFSFHTSPSFSRSHVRSFCPPQISAQCDAVCLCPCTHVQAVGLDPKAHYGPVNLWVRIQRLVFDL